MAYYSIAPFGEERADLRAGIVAAVMANTARGKNQRAFKPSEFMPKFDNRPKHRQSDKEMFAIFKTAARAAAAYTEQQRKKGKT